MTDEADSRRTLASTLREVRDCLHDAVVSGYRGRILGLAAEAAFYALLSLPPLLYGLAGAVGFIARTFDVASISAFRTQVLMAAQAILTPDAIAKILAPTLDEVLANGRADIMSIGFLISLWSGSRAVSVFVDTCTIMYGMQRGFVRTRLIGLGLYVVFILGGSVLIPLILAGPTLIYDLLPSQLRFLADFYWPAVVIGSIGLLASLYHIARPTRGRWVAEVPGSFVTFLLSAFFSWLLRVFLASSFGGGHGSAAIYGPLATPIGVMLWLYLLELAILIGAVVNAAIGRTWPAITRRRPPRQRPATEPATSPPAEILTPDEPAKTLSALGNSENPRRSR